MVNLWSERSAFWNVLRTRFFIAIFADFAPGGRRILPVISGNSAHGGCFKNRVFLESRVHLEVMELVARSWRKTSTGSVTGSARTASAEANAHEFAAGPILRMFLFLPEGFPSPALIADSGPMSSTISGHPEESRAESLESRARGWSILGLGFRWAAGRSAFGVAGFAVDLAGEFFPGAFDEF